MCVTICLDIIIGLVTVTFINCSALCGAIILPFRKRAAFKWILSAFIGLGNEKCFKNKFDRLMFVYSILAVGTLTGSGIFHLIPMVSSLVECT
jgi:hypothetical protein